MELIYLTPLSNWNPYNVEYKGKSGTAEAKSVTVGQKRNGKNNPAQAFDGIHSKLYYMTPSAFFVKGKDAKEPADQKQCSCP